MRISSWWALCFGFFFGWCSVQFSAGWTIQLSLVENPTPLEQVIMDSLIQGMGGQDDYYPMPEWGEDDDQSDTDYEYRETVDIQCLHEAVYFEAGNQSYSGKRAVAEVIRNRVESNKFPDTYCEVVNQDKQFSFTLFETNYNLDRKAWEESESVAVEVFFADDTETDSMWYHADYISAPVWTTRLNRVERIGQHIFYEEI